MRRMTPPKERFDIHELVVDVEAGLIKAEATVVSTADHSKASGVIVDYLRHPQIGGLVSKLVEAVKACQHTGGEDNCSTCAAACCSKPWTIALSRWDVQAVSQFVGHHKFYEDNPQGVINGVPFKIKPVKDKRAVYGARCPLLKMTKHGDGWQGRCSVYDARPMTCRSYPAHNCEEYVPVKALLRKVKP